jgi:predicted nucleic acid-binding protein
VIVVDASLAAKWMLWERDSKHALDFLLRYGQEFCAPDLLFIEVAGVIVRKANIRRAEGTNIDADALEALRKWTIAWGQHVVKPHRVTQRRTYAAGKLAIELGHPVKDCIYLVLAMEFNCDLATCDAKFQVKCRDIYPQVRLLGDYDLPIAP